MADVSKIKLPNGTTYNIKDKNALPLTGGSVTGPVSFGDSVSIDEATVGDLVVNGSASFTNNLQANTINGVTVGSSPKFTDTTYSNLAAASGGTAVSLVTTGEKYTWNNKIGATTPTIATDTGTSTITLASAGKYKLTAGGGSVIFTMPTIPTVSYPVTSVNSKTGAVSLTAADVGALASNTTYVSKITTTAGAHTVISNKSGAVSFNIPTKTSHLTNDSGFITGITKAMVTTALGTGSGTTKFLREDGSWATPAYIANTDAKLQVAEVTSTTQYYPLVGTGTTAATRQYDTTGFKYKGTTGTTSAVGSAIVELGNSTASGTAGNKQAQLIMYGSNAKKATITLAAPSADIALALPTSGGTIALTSQIPDISGKADKATTLSGYGITDAKIASGTITLGSNTITPLTSSSSLNAAKLTGTVPASCYTNTTYSDFTAATASAAGTHGLVPAPSAGSQNCILFGDKTWKEFGSQVTYAGDELTLSLVASAGSGSSTQIASFNIQTASASTIGAMSAADKSYIDTLASTLGEVNKPSEYTVSSITTGNSYKTTGYGFTLSSGTYIIIGRIEFPANATGIRAVEWHQTTGTTGGVYHSQITTPAATGGFPTRLQSVAIVEPEGNQTYQLYVYQNSGATLSNAKVSIRSIRIS